MRSVVQEIQELQFGDYQSCCWELIAYVHKNRTSHIFGKTNSCGTHASVASRRSFLWFCHHVIRIGRENGRQLPVLRNGGALVPARFGRRRNSSHLLVSVASERDTSPRHGAYHCVIAVGLRGFRILYPSAGVSTATHRISPPLSPFICAG